MSDFYAYEIYPPVDMPLKAAPINRPWMDASQQRFAYRCLPLTIAIQQGWQKNYFQGRDPGTEIFPDHQTKIAIQEFEER